jgi:hypothetical protein
MRPRALIASVIAIACLVGSAVAVAGSVDDEFAQRARVAQVISDTFGYECAAGCSAGVRAKDRAARIAEGS